MDRVALLRPLLAGVLPVTVWRLWQLVEHVTRAEGHEHSESLAEIEEQARSQPAGSEPAASRDLFRDANTHGRLFASRGPAG